MKTHTICLLVILMSRAAWATSVLRVEEVSTSSESVEGSTTDEPRVCPDGFVNLEDRCYHFATSSQTWFNALKTCITLGANLASLETLRENELIKNHLRELDPLRISDWWLSASDDSQEGVFVWVNSMQLVELTDWCPNDPNNVYDESCVHMVASCDYKWQERSCDYSNRYICEV